MLDNYRELLNRLRGSRNERGGFTPGMEQENQGFPGGAPNGPGMGNFLQMGMPGIFGQDMNPPGGRPEFGRRLEMGGRPEMGRRPEFGGRPGMGRPEMGRRPEFGGRPGMGRPEMGRRGPERGPRGPMGGAENIPFF